MLRASLADIVIVLFLTGLIGRLYTALIAANRPLPGEQSRTGIVAPRARGSLTKGDNATERNATTDWVFRRIFGARGTGETHGANAVAGMTCTPREMLL